MQLPSRLRTTRVPLFAVFGALALSLLFVGALFRGVGRPSFLRGALTSVTIGEAGTLNRDIAGPGHDTQVPQNESRDQFAAGSASGAAGSSAAPATAALSSKGIAPSAVAPAPPGVGPAANASQVLPPLPSIDRMIVKTGSLTVQVTDLVAAIQRVSAVVSGIPGAYVASSSTSYRAETKESSAAASSPPGVVREVPALKPVSPSQPAQSASITVKVPADSFGDAVTRLRELGTPISENVSTQEVTEEYVDLEAQVRNLEATEQQYIRFLDRAQRIEEILPIQQRLTEVRNQIERLRGRMTLLQRRSDTSTITLTLIMPAGRVAPIDEPRAVRTLREAFAGLGVALQGVLDVSIYLGVYLLPLVPFVLLYLWWRNRRPGGSGNAAPGAPSAPPASAAA